jgi:hypothetical protein
MVFGGLVLAVLVGSAAFASVGVAARLAPSPATGGGDVPPERAQLALVSLLVFYALVVTSVFLLGYTGTLTAPRLACTSLVLSALTTLGCARGVGLRAHVRATVRAAARILWLPVGALLLTARARSLALLVLVAALVVIVASAVLTYLAPSESWDGLFYHEPMVGFALQNHGFGDVPLSANPMAQTINGYPRGCEAFALFFVAFSGRALIEIGNTAAAPGLILAVYLLARRFAEPALAIAMASVTLLMPAMWTELRTTYTDIQIIFFVVAALHFATRPVLRWRDAGIALVAMALAIAGKGTGLTLVPPVALVLAVRLLMWVPRGRRLATFAAIFGGGVALLAIAALTLVPNWRHHHDPVWPVTIEVPRLHLHFDGLIKYSMMNPEGPLKDTLAEKYDVPRGGFDDIHNRDYGYAFPWVIIPFGLLSALAALIVSAVHEVRRSRQPGGAGNMVLLLAVAFAWMLLSNNLRWARFNAQSLFVLAVAVAWAGGRPGWSRVGEGLLGAAVALSIVPLFWTHDWYFGLSAHQIRHLARMPAAARATAYSDPNGMPASVAAARDAELRVGDVLVFNQDETWLGLMWNADFSNVVEYVPSDSPAQFTAELEARHAKWVVIGKNAVAQRVIAGHPETWEAVGTATKIDETTAYRRR